MLRIPEGIETRKLVRVLALANELWPRCTVKPSYGGSGFLVRWEPPEPEKPTGLAALFAPSPPRQCGAVDEAGVQCIRHAGHESVTEHTSIDEFGVVLHWGDDLPEPELAWTEDATHKADDF